MLITFSLKNYVSKTSEIRADLNFLKHSRPIAAQDIPTLKAGERVLLTGVITENNPRVYVDLVMGVREHDMGEDGWEVEVDPEVQINLEIEKGQSIPLFVDDPFPQGNYVSMSTGYFYRWRGYTANTLLCSFATVQKTPLLFYGEKHFAGTPKAYLQNLQSRLLREQIEAGLTLAVLSFFLIYAFKNALEDDTF